MGHCAKKGTNILKWSQFPGWKICPRHNWFITSFSCKDSNGNTKHLVLSLKKDNISYSYSYGHWRFYINEDDQNRFENTKIIQWGKEPYWDQNGYHCRSWGHLGFDMSLLNKSYSLTGHIRVIKELIIPEIEKQIKESSYEDVNIYSIIEGMRQ